MKAEPRHAWNKRCHPARLRPSNSTTMVQLIIKIGQKTGVAFLANLHHNSNVAESADDNQASHSSGAAQTTKPATLSTIKKQKAAWIKAPVHMGLSFARNQILKSR